MKEIQCKRNNKFSDLPRMYSVVWCRIEWVMDYCTNGYHDQQVGCYRFQVRRVRVADNSWQWKSIKSARMTDFDWLNSFQKKDAEEWLLDCSTDLGEGLDWSYKISDLPNLWKD